MGSAEFRCPYAGNAAARLPTPVNAAISKAVLIRV
jgi:hypothetical protein